MASNSLPVPIDFESIISAALSKQAKALEAERADALEQQAVQFHKIVSDLENKMTTLLTNTNVPAPHPSPALKVNTTSSSSGSASKKGKETAKTPSRVARAKSEPPVAIKATPASTQKAKSKPSQAGQGTPSPASHKRHPAQLLVSEVPKDFQRVKV